MIFLIELPNTPSPNGKTQMVLVPSSDSGKDNLKIDSNSKRFIKPAESVLLIKSKVSNAGVYINPDVWQLTTTQQFQPDTEFTFITKSKYGHASLSVENGSIDLAEIPRIALNNFKKSFPDGEIVYSEYRTVNNAKILYVGTRGTAKGINIIFLTYYYTGKKQVIQLSTFTAESHWNDSKNDLQHLLDGLVILDK
jgi:hypothetical protein